MSEDAGLARFAVELYGRPGVGDACLLLQDRAGVNVVILLTAVWTAARSGARLTEADIGGLHAQVADWNAHVVQPLRSARRWLKTSDVPAAAERATRLRTEVKKLELDAELIELDMLEAAASDIGVADGHESTAAGTAERNGLAVLSFYSSRAARDDERQALLTIARSATSGVS
ncbi:TIGR02444 family protein [Chelatococcus reniformis]|uniref:TIGR02444 family protein n=1 Tax=Chelatococcus reniformis TaxID=1494448 RepID=A0A916XRL1_9HYPH|nr:TIGR02444 family protein [Chelatococcus reniformis]GGC92840.1 hypothetical protein GCM10010994_58300 [Chelatococcus reniformis]